MDLQKEFPEKTLFWKYMIVALQAMEQEYELYERLARDRRFDMSRHLGKTVERFYQAAATGYQPDEKYILAVEESYFEPRDEYEKPWRAGIARRYRSTISLSCLRTDIL